METIKIYVTRKRRREAKIAYKPSTICKSTAGGIQLRSLASTVPSAQTYSVEASYVPDYLQQGLTI